MEKNMQKFHDHGHDISYLLDKMPDIDHFFAAAPVFQQLSDSSRLRILWLLCHTEECGNNIAAALGMSPAAVSHHLKSLKSHNLIRGRRSGKEVYYKLADNEGAHLVHKMVDDYFQMTCPEKGLL